MVNDLIYQLALDILECVVDGFADEAITLPTRQYVHQGEVALDCEQLVVTFSGLVQTLPLGAEEVTHCPPPRSAIFDVWLTRCVPTLKDNGDSPDAADLDASAEALQTDAWVLANVLFTSHQSGCWGASCDSVLYGPVLPYGPEGAYGGSHAALTVSLI